MGQLAGVIRLRTERGSCGATGAGLLVCPGEALGTPAVLLRRGKATSPMGAQLCWRDQLAPATPEAVLW